VGTPVRFARRYTLRKRYSPPSCAVVGPPSAGNRPGSEGLLAAESVARMTGLRSTCRYMERVALHIFRHIEADELDAERCFCIWLFARQFVNSMLSSH
jgi:hypothetical protein